MVKTFSLSYPPSPNLDRVTVAFDEVNGSDLILIILFTTLNFESKYSNNNFNNIAPLITLSYLQYLWLPFW